jgi:hypothetical protein
MELFRIYVFHLSKSSVMYKQIILVIPCMWFYDIKSSHVPSPDKGWPYKFSLKHPDECISAQDKVEKSACAASSHGDVGLQQRRKVVLPPCMKKQCS